jgi:hypothetical protein
MLRPTRVSKAPLSPAWLAGLVTEIDFDFVSSGTVINNQYARFGVTFEAVTLSNTLPGANFGSVFAAKDPFAETSPNIIAISQNGSAFHEGQGGIRATFSSPQLFVSIDALPIFSDDDPSDPNTNTPYLLVFGLPIYQPAPYPPIWPEIARITFPVWNKAPNFQSWQTMDYVSTSPTPNIGSIIFSSSYSGIGEPVYAVFDRLRFAHELSFTKTVEVG